MGGSNPALYIPLLSTALRHIGVINTGAEQFKLMKQLPDLWIVRTAQIFQRPYIPEDVIILMIILNRVSVFRKRTHVFLQLADDLILIFTGAATSALSLPIKLCDILCAGNCCEIEPSELIISVMCLMKGVAVTSELGRLNH